MTREELLDRALCCNRCGSCRGVSQDAVPDHAFSTQCPSGMTLFGAYEPAGLIYSAKGMALGVLEWDKHIADTLFSCTLCGYCEDLCSRGYRHTPAVSILEELRRSIPEHFKPASLTKAAQSTGIPTSHQLHVLESYGITDPASGTRTDTILFADRTIVRNAKRLGEIGFLLQKSGKRTGCFIAPPLPPVDTILLSAGYQERLEEYMEEIDTRLQSFGIKRVICYNPESLSVLKRYSNSRAEFLPITQVYAQLLNKKAHKKLKLPPVTYQDPCHLGRYAGDYLTPRLVIEKLGLRLKEMWRTRHNSLCCGAGGGVLLDRPKLAKLYAANRWREAWATGAKLMVTACPFCTINLKQSRPKGGRVMDITSLVARAYGYK